MLKTDTVTKICGLLEGKYGDLGRAAGDRLQAWLSGDLPYAYPEQLAKHLSEEHIDLLFDAFWQVLPFGTGGRRGRVGYGSNRMNPTTVAMTVQGHCNYLNATFAGRELKVVVANDVRVFNDVAGVYGFLEPDHPLIGVSARSLGRLACQIYAANGITAYCVEPESDDAVLTTPELAFVISRIGAIGGINLSASHNPPDDNGIKVYDEFGSQPVAPHDQRLIDHMSQAREVRSVEFADALAAGSIRAIPDELHRQYVAIYVEMYDGIHTPDKAVPITFTPLCGCGLTTVGDVLGALGFNMITPPDEAPDGGFTVIPFKAPNPEVPQATQPARKYADSHGSTIVLSSDPDADRIGVEIKLADGSWAHLDGNQIAAILCYFLMLDPDGPQRRGLVVETLVTNKILGGIVREAGDSWIIDDLLVGFKYVADVLKTLGRGEAYGDVTCKPEQLVLAAEESHGVIMAHDILDKDAVPACMYLAALHQRLQARGETLLDYYARILEHLGEYDCVNRSIMMLGAQGVLRRDQIMDALRANPLTELNGQPVRKIVDRWNEAEFGAFVSASDRSPRNVLQIITDTIVVTVRPSGTEAKLKLYVQILPDPDRKAGTGGLALLAESRKRADAMASVAYNALLSRIDCQLSEIGLLLPDIIDLDCKIEFDSKTVPQLEEAIASGRFGSLDDLLAWLTERSAVMTPGTDSLPALRAPIARLCAQWATKFAGNEQFAGLAAWAGAAQ